MQKIKFLLVLCFALVVSLYFGISVTHAQTSTLSVIITPDGGNVSRSPSGTNGSVCSGAFSTCNSDYANGTSVTVTAIPYTSNGWEFSTWGTNNGVVLPDTCLYNPVCTFTINQSFTLYAYFYQAVMSGTITGPSSCVITAGANSCNVGLSWDTSYPESVSSLTSSYPAPNTVLATANSGYQSISIPYVSSPRTFYLYNNSKSLVPTSPSGSGKVVTASCASGSTWNGSICLGNPSVPTVTTPTVSNITETSATLGANVTSLGLPASITARGTCYGTTPAPTTNCVAEGGTTTGAFTHSRNGFTLSTLYYYRGYATNATGTGYSPDGSFTTAGSVASNTCPSGVPFVQSKTLGTTALSTFGDIWLGGKITIGASPVTVTSLGRIIISGNVNTHILKLVNAATGVDVPGGSVSINTIGGIAGSFKYANLSSPVTLSANTSYYIASRELNWGDEYYYSYDTFLTPSSVATINGSVDNGSGTWNFTSSPNQTFVPVDFCYVPVSPDLIASDPNPTVAGIGVPVVFTSTITNNGINSTGVSFPNLFQTSPVSDGSSGAVDYPVTPNMSALAGSGANAVSSKAITFSTQGTMYVRACADKSSAGSSGVVMEASEINNCSSWVPVTVSNINNAEFISQSIPSSMATSQVFPVTVIMKNTGTTTWTSGGLYRLGSQNPQDNMTFGSNRPGILASGDSIAANSQKTFNFNITAPNTPGTYNFQTKMVQDGVQWFGDLSTNVAIVVVTGVNLTPSSVTPYIATVGVPQSYSSTIVNSGTLSTNSSFSNFFQVATLSDGGGVITDLDSSNMSVLNAGSSATTTSPSYTFSSVGNPSIRACTDKTNRDSVQGHVPPNGAVINESDENDNCSPWINVTVSSPSVTPSLTSPTISALTNTTAFLGATVSSLGVPASITARGTCYGTTPAPTTNCVAEGGTTTGSFTHSRTGLTPNTVYYYRGYATNSTGTGYSADGTFTTTVSPTSSILLNPTSIFQGSSSTLTWSSANAASCVGTNFSTGGLVNNPTGISVNPLTTTTYTVTCDGVPASTTLTVKKRPGFSDE
ncbi:MAG: hypothetical protein AAB510_01160 [Patescibacteria group bacterium]